MQKGFFCSVLTKTCYWGYSIAEYLYGSLYRPLKNRNSKTQNITNPYKYISLYPLTLKIDIESKEYSSDPSWPKYSIITPVLNEEKTIETLLQSIASQSFLPDEVIIIDCGSEDNTIQKINDYIKYACFEITILFSPIKNISYQRNMGIKHARNDLIVQVDAGTILDKNYTANIVGPFTQNQDLDLVGGVRYPQNNYPWSIHFCHKNHFRRRIKPYGNSLAYRKSLAIQCGLYPEYVTYAGEDTFFLYMYQKLSKHWILNKAAFVLWEHPNTFNKAVDKVLNYMIGNFEIGLWPYLYNGTHFHLPIWIGYFFKKFRDNYPTFLNKQVNIELNKRHIKGLKFILSKNRITDSGNEALQAIAVKFIAEHYKVFFVDFATEPPQDPTPMFIDTDNSLLELVHYTNFYITDFEKRYGNFIDSSVFMLHYANNKILQDISALQKKFKGIKVKHI